MDTNHGVYFLANDRVYEIAIAFLNSFRASNPAIPLCLIPYSDDIAHLTQLSREYKFEVYSNRKLLADCDCISRMFYEERVGEFRKLAAWSGPFERFVYIDIDTVVFKPVDFVFSLLDHYDVLTSHSNYPESRRWTWRDSIFKANILTNEQIEYSANMGFIASRGKLFPIDIVSQMAVDASRIKKHMELSCMDQPFLNYMIITAGLRYSSLHVLRDRSGLHYLPHECWAGDRKWRVEVDGTSSYDGAFRDLFFIHWAGEWAPLGETRRLVKFYDSLGPELRLRTRDDMKLFHVWSYFRNMPRQSLSPYRTSEPTS